MDIFVVCRLYDHLKQSTAAVPESHISIIYENKQCTNYLGDINPLIETNKFDHELIRSLLERLWQETAQERNNPPERSSFLFFLLYFCN